ncbi:MAG: hypothetical protein QUS14_12065 [Pyrinomonadaceae bacterium]|nr:hypothetical protein [Pyrinomonadaceae bacterium]
MINRISLLSIVLSSVLAGMLTTGIYGQQETKGTETEKAEATTSADGAVEMGKESKKSTFAASISEADRAALFEPAFDPRLPAKETSFRNSDRQTPQDDAAALAKKLSNPVSSLISLPFQSNWDFGMGPNGDGFRQTLNVQPVIPITLNKDWNLISRTIIPIIGQQDVVADGSSQFGLGDITQAFFFSPNKTEPVIWAIGPQMMIPTATNQYLGSKKLSLGPTFLILKQQGPWTVGTLMGHFWSVAGSDTRPPVSLTNFQPFVSYGTKSAWTFTLNTESTYDWKAEQWNVPLHLSVAKLVRFGKQPVSIGGTLRCWTASGPTGPEGCGFRMTVTPLFPRK